MSRTRSLVMVLVTGLAVTVLQTGSASATNIGEEGCTPGYWKQSQHFDSWEEYAPTTLLSTMFSHNGVSAFDGVAPEIAAYKDLTALEGLRLKGGSGVAGATEILLRAATAAFLNAATEGVGYPYRRYTNPFQIGTQVAAALASGDRATMLDLATTLDAANNLGCPLN